MKRIFPILSIFIEECYGTASEQMAEFERMMPYYAEQEITQTKLVAIDSIFEA